MSKPNNKTVTMTTESMKAIDAQLDASALRSRGLMHLLATAYAKADLGDCSPPTYEEIQGVLWLSMQVGEELTNACAEASRGWHKQTPPPTESAA